MKKWCGARCGGPILCKSPCPSSAAKPAVSSDLVSPWHPMTNAKDLKHLGKLGEEAAELGAAVSRCIIQGIDEAEPVTGKVNRAWLSDEIADVLANVRIVMEHFALDGDYIVERSERKYDGLTRWHGML